MVLSLYVCVELQESREIVKWRQTVFCYAASSVHGKTLKHCVSLTLDAPTLLSNYSSESMHARQLYCNYTCFCPQLVS